MITGVKPCPFCGGKAAEHPNEKWRDTYFVVYHEVDCYLSNHSKPPCNFSLLPKNYRIDEWNKRSKRSTKAEL